MGEIEQLLDAYTSTVRAKDVDGFTALYADDVRVFDTWGRWSYDGLAAWREMAEGWFGSLGDEQVRVDFDDVRVAADDRLAVAHAFVTYRGLSAAGDELRSMNGRMTWALELRDGAWKVVHEHSSSPADSETATVMFQRT